MIKKPITLKANARFKTVVMKMKDGCDICSRENGSKIIKNLGIGNVTKCKKSSSKCAWCSRYLFLAKEGYEVRHQK